VNREEVSKSLVETITSQLSENYSNLTIVCEILDSARNDVNAPFALLAIEMPRAEVSRAVVTAIVLDVFKSIVDAACFSNLGGIELMFRDNNHRRIVRISVTRNGYASIMRLKPEDIDKPGPYAGIGCWIYDTTLI
jgi:hypothetical protein